MFLPHTKVFKDIRQEAIDDISKIAVEEMHGKGTMLFSAGSQAKDFYILVDGTVGLTIGNEATAHYTVSEIGESFGWSSLVGRDFYSANAECLEPTKVIRIGSAELEKVFDAHARSGRVFYRRLAEALGQRWLDAHGAFMSELERDRDVSYGTGRIAITEED